MSDFTYNPQLTSQHSICETNINNTFEFHSNVPDIYNNIVIRRTKTEINPEETTTRSQLLSKHVSAATNNHTATMELLEAVFSIQYMLRLYRKPTRVFFQLAVETPCGGG
jgi:hypothetical protein